MSYLRLILAMLLYGISFISTSIALSSLGPVTILAVRLVISALFLIVLDAAIPGGNETRRWPHLVDLPAILLITLFQPILYFLAENTGLQSVSPSIASIVIGTIPVFTPLAARLVLRDRFPLAGYLGVAVSLAGVVLIILDEESSAQFSLAGIALIFGAVLAAVGYTIALRLLSPRYRPLTVAKLQSVVGLAPILLLSLSLEGVPSTLPPAHVIAHLVFLGVFPSSLAFVFLNRGIRELGPSRANVFVNLVPVFTALVSWLFLAEAFSLRKIAGMAVVILGVFVVQRVRASLTPPAASPTIGT